MNAKEIQNLSRAASFQPFEISLPNGSTLRIDHPEFMAFSRAFRTLHFYPNEGGACHVDIKLITKRNVLPPRSRKQTQKA